MSECATVGLCRDPVHVLSHSTREWKFAAMLPCSCGPSTVAHNCDCIIYTCFITLNCFELWVKWTYTQAALLPCSCVTIVILAFAAVLTCSCITFVILAFAALLPCSCITFVILASAALLPCSCTTIMILALAALLPCGCISIVCFCYFYLSFLYCLIL